MAFKSIFAEKSTIPTSILKEIAFFLEEKENVTVLWLPGGGRTTFGIDVQNRPIIQKAAKARKLKKILFVYVDLKLDPLRLDTHLEEYLSQFSSSHGVRNKLTDMLNRGYFVYFILDNIGVETMKNVDYILAFRSLDSRKIKFINLMLEKDYHALMNSDNVLPSSFFQNVVKVPYFDKQETLAWVKDKSKEFRLKLNQEKKEALQSYCGGIPVLLKNCLRSLRTHVKVEDAYDSLEMRSIVSSFWNKFNDNEKQVLLHAYRRLPLPPYTTEIQYLREHRMLSAGNFIEQRWLRYVSQANMHP